ncbi:bidirectional sugar transporter SWEET12-like protein [Actinidia rufa]|uniref:Bidirectional sugar transporter SWEET n=1 Tax=Actinidia rufa TaxID=165716 RepID=A0A7J0FNG9_9ERIC|nr:bidirectional sugar transporter SWEET12-like protein [Actinidia rufa]
MLWMYYAFLKTDAILLISVNSIGCFIETIYIAIYLAYGSREARNHTAKLLASLNVGFFSVILLFTLLLVKDSNRVLVVGWVCVAISVSVFAAPLSIVFQVVRTRSVEFMPFTLSFFLTMTAIMWFGYGLLLKDLYIALPNILGFLLGVLQMLLYGMYRNAKPVLELEKKQLPDQHMINIVVSGIPDEVHPVDAKMGRNEQTDHNNEKCSVDETSKANGQLHSPGLVVCIAS